MKVVHRLNYLYVTDEDICLLERFTFLFHDRTAMREGVIEIF